MKWLLTPKCLNYLFSNSFAYIPSAQIIETAYSTPNPFMASSIGRTPAELIVAIAHDPAITRTAKNAKTPLILREIVTAIISPSILA